MTEHYADVQKNLMFSQLAVTPYQLTEHYADVQQNLMFSQLAVTPYQLTEHYADVQQIKFPFQFLPIGTFCFLLEPRQIVFQYCKI